MNEREPILIVGTGALASLFAARLARVGREVIMLGSWPEALRAIQEHGVRLVEADGRESSHRLIVTRHPAKAGPARHALVLVKSWQTVRAAGQLATCLAPDGLALTLQNGAGNQEILAQALGSSRVAFGVTSTGAHLLGPGRVQEAGIGSISVGLHPRFAPLRDALQHAGFVVEPCVHAASLLWGKLVVNAAINPVTALLSVPNGLLLKIPSARDLVLRIAREVAAVAEALGVHLPYPDPGVAVEAVACETAANHSSMLQDLMRGAPTEIDAICGAVIRAGEQTGVPTPLNRTLWLLIHARIEAMRVSESALSESESVCENGCRLR